MAYIGSWALVLSLVVSLYGAIVALVGTQQRSRRFIESAERAVWVVATLATLASALLFYSLITRDFQVRYVAEYTSTHLPLVYTISAFWAGQEGSLLLWFWFLAVLTVLVVLRTRTPAAQHRYESGKTGPFDGLRASSYLLAILASVEAWFAVLLVATSNPFTLLPSRPLEGSGLLPLLENPGMVIHPPVLFLGYAAYTVPFAFALAALMSGELKSDWLKATRPWSLLAWLALSAGILIGAWWSYVELGWGGYWAWDPVENASLIPWLVGTAFLHSSIMQERRGMHRVWNMLLPTLIFVLCLFATLVTRGGIIISDLHGFSRSIQPIAYYLLTFIVLALGGSFFLVYHRRDRLASQRQIESLLSREASLYLSEMLLCGAALIVFTGTVYPTLAQALRGALISLDSSFYSRAVGPVMAIVICLMGICPIIGWQRISNKNWTTLAISSFVALTVAAFILGVTEPFPLISTAICTFVIVSLLGTVMGDLLARHRSTGENYARAFVTVVSKAQRRYGANLVHLGIILIAIGVTGSTAYKHERLIGLKPGEETTIGRYTVQYQDYSIETLNPNPVTYQSRIRYATRLGVYRDGSRVSTLVAEKNYHWALDTPWVTEVAIHSNWREDLYIILASLEEDGMAGFQMVINPLVNWIWIGGGVLMVGTLLAGLHPALRNEGAAKELD